MARNSRFIFTNPLIHIHLSIQISLDKIIIIAWFLVICWLLFPSLSLQLIQAEKQKSWGRCAFRIIKQLCALYMVDLTKELQELRDSILAVARYCSSSMYTYKVGRYDWLLLISISIYVFRILKSSWLLFQVAFPRFSNNRLSQRHLACQGDFIHFFSNQIGVCRSRVNLVVW